MPKECSRASLCNILINVTANLYTIKNYKNARAELLQKFYSIKQYRISRIEDSRSTLNQDPPCSLNTHTLEHCDSIKTIIKCSIFHYIELLSYTNKSTQNANSKVKPPIPKLTTESLPWLLQSKKRLRNLDLSQTRKMCHQILVKLSRLRESLIQSKTTKREQLNLYISSIL